MRTSQKKFRISMAAMWLPAVVVMMFVAGCDSRNLTSSSARSLIQDRIDADNPMGETFNYVPYIRQAGFGAKTFTDYSQDQFEGTNPAAAMHRLLEAGLLEKRTETQSYPNLTGSYEDMRTEHVTYYEWQHVRYVTTKDLVGLHPLTLSMQQGSMAISGNYTYAVNGGGHCEGLVSGKVNADGGVDLELRNTGNYCPTEVNGYHKWDVQLVSAGGVKLIGPATVYNTKSTGTSTLTTYRYLLTEKLKTTSDGMVTIGKFRVDSVTNLLLDTDVSASAQYTWHVDYNNIGQAIMGKTSTSGTSSAEFRKQPDGNWVCVSH